MRLNSKSVYEHEGIKACKIEVRHFFMTELGSAMGGVRVVIGLRARQQENRV